jgi:hypothetical protein
MEGNEMNQLNDLLGGADPGTEPQPNTDEETTNEETPSNEEAQTDNKEEQQQQQEQPQISEDEKRRNEAFARFRAENKQYKELIDRVAEKYGAAGVDELKAKLDQENLEAEAKELKMSPEAIKRMKALEDQNRQITENSRRQQIISKFDQVQKAYDLDQDQLKGFVEKLRDNRVDVLNTSVPIDTLYKAFNYEDLVKKEIETAKEQWIEQSNKANNSSGTLKNKGKGSGSNQKVNTVNELNNLLKDL